MNGFKVRIIKSLSNDENKLKLLSKIEVEQNKISIIESLSNDESKLKALSYTENEGVKAHIIKNLNSDESKISALKELSNESLKIDVIINLRDKDNIPKALTYLKDKDIIATLENFYIKEEEELYLENANDIDNVILLEPYMTIGVELEAEGNSSSLIKEKDSILDWGIKNDGSLEKGVEIVSPILHAKDEKSIYAIANMMKKSGLETTERCGGHIHIGAHVLDSKESIDTLYYDLWCNLESVMYKISNPKGNILREGAKDYAIAMSGLTQEALEKGELDISSDNKEETINQIIDFQIKNRGRYSGINFMNLDKGINTVEFRLSNGTIEPKEIINNINLYGSLVQSSKKLGDIELKKKQGEELSNEEVRILNLRDKIIELESDDEKLDVMLELLFDDDKVRDVYKERYEWSKEYISKTENNVYDKLKFSKGKFNLKDYKKGCEAQISQFALEETTPEKVMEEFESFEPEIENNLDEGGYRR